MLYYEARLSERWPAVEIRVADVCLDVEDALLLGALCRALVMTASAQVGSPVADVPPEALRAASFVASRRGLRGELVNPADGRPRPAAEVVDALLAHLRESLERAGDRELVLVVVARLRRQGTGADRQRSAWQRGGQAAVLDLVALS